jgi:hypothetical protein
MSMKFMISAAAVLAVLAGPALAGDQDTETELRDSGRYVPQANLPEVPMPGARVQSGPYASKPYASAPYASAMRPTRFVAPRAVIGTPANDFQLQGR